MSNSIGSVALERRVDALFSRYTRPGSPGAVAAVMRGSEIELAKMDLQAMGKHHLIPLSWIDYVDEKVHLSLDREETEARWTKAN